MPTLGKILTVERKSTNDDNDDNTAQSRPSSFSTQVSMGTEEPVEVDPEAERQEAELRAKIKASLHSQHVSRKVVEEEEAKKTYHREEQQQQFNPPDDEQTFDWETQQQRRMKRQFFKQQAKMLKQSVEQQKGRRDDNDNTLSQPSSSSTQVSMGSAVEEGDLCRASAMDTSDLANDNNDNSTADNNTQRQQTSPSVFDPQINIHQGHSGWIHCKTINNNDVLSGRGGRIMNHPGNVAFRNIIETYKVGYLGTTKKKKAQIVAEIVSDIRSSGGRFLKEVPQTEVWVEIGDEKALKKTGQALREGASEIRQVQRQMLLNYQSHAQQQQIQMPTCHRGIRQNNWEEEQRQQFNPQSPQEQTYTVNNMTTHDLETQRAIDQQRGRHEQHISQATAQSGHTRVTQAPPPPTTTMASTNIYTYMSLSQSAIDGASSLPQLYEIRNRLKTKLDYVENKINYEMMKKAFMMGQQALPRTRNNPPDNESERYQQHQSKKRRVDAESQPPAPIVVTGRQNRNTMPSSIRQQEVSLPETTPSSSPKRGKLLPTLTDQQQRQLSTIRQQEAAVSEESDGMSKDTTAQYPCRDEDSLTLEQEVPETDQNAGSTATQVKSEEADIWMRVKEEETDDESVEQIMSSSTVSSSSLSVSKPTDVERPHTQVYENTLENLGKRRAYQGCVVSFDREVGWYEVIYEDGESEEYTLEELEGYLQDKVETVLIGKLSYQVKDDLRCHVIHGKWKENDTSTPQKFELVYELAPDEDPKVLPKDANFNGSFVVAKFVRVNESNVQLSFTSKEGKSNEYSVNGKGMNQFGLFTINGVATKGAEDDMSYKLRLRKRYITSYKSPNGDSEGDDDDTSSMYED